MTDPLDELFAAPAATAADVSRNLETCKVQDFGPWSPPFFGLAPTEVLSRLDAEEREWCKRAPGLLEAFAHALRCDLERQRGERPPHYTHASECAGCGPVLLWVGAPAHVLACPWCANRAGGLPIPRP